VRERKIPFTEQSLRLRERGGTAVSARELGVDEHAVVKTLIMEDDAGKPLDCADDGDREVSTKELARLPASAASVPAPPMPPTPYRLPGRRHLALRHQEAVPVCMESSILTLGKIYLNGGSAVFWWALTLRMSSSCCSRHWLQ